jgi:cell wall-associated NlpC family hydrolase
LRPTRRVITRSQRLLGLALTVGLFLSMSGVAQAEHNSAAGTDRDIPSRVVELAEANQRLHELGAAIQTRQEGVNKAIVDVQTARDTAATAQRDVDATSQAVTDANAAIAAAQRRFDSFAATTYINGPPGSYLTATSPEDIIATAAAGQTLSVGFQQALTDLRRARTELTNKESAARASRQQADQAAAETQRSQDAAVAALTEAQANFGGQQAEVDRLVAERDTAQTRLNAVRGVGHLTTQPPPQPTGPAPADQWDRAPSTAPAPLNPSQWDTTLPMVPSANIAGDPVALVNTVLHISSTSAQVTADLGRKFLASLGINLGGGAPAAADPGITNGRIPRVYGRQASEYVIRRAVSQMGVPYSWGGGNANGPSRGIDQGANTVGFDCSGLILYAFAGVGIKLPHYSGSQYNAGRKIPSSQMRRGDLIFYGPNASQHEALYLGDGMMLEAPYTGSQVKVSPVRSSGMTPYVTRLIEY